jgi:hypothetical protein
MKVRLIPLLAAPLLLALAASQCPKRGDDLSRLGELPPEVAARLKRVPNTELLISMPPVAVGKPLVRPDKKFCGSANRSFVQLTYPITICYPPSYPDAGILVEHRGPAKSPTTPPLSPESGAGRTLSFKLSSFAGETSPLQRRCVQKWGPWLATVVEEDPCSGPITFTLTILGVPPCPECPQFVWYDKFDNHPQELNLILPLVDTQHSEIDCDPGDLTNCGGGDGDPNPNPTPVGPPAIK